MVSVTDRKGHFVQDLKPADLNILDNDEKQQTLTFFQSQTDLPLRVALLIDVSSSVAGQFEAEKDTIGAFLRQVVRSEDSVNLFAFNQDVHFIAPIDNNWKKVSRRVKHLKADGNTALYDAVNDAASWLASDREPARRIIILITDGQENSSHVTLDQTIAHVLMAEGVIYAVNVDDDTTSDLSREAAVTLKQLSDATGGSYLHSSADGSVGRVFAKIQRELRSQYAIAYRPSNLDAEFHRLEVVAPRNLRVRCRTGYYIK